jgi:hypothetical protein
MKNTNIKSYNDIKMEIVRLDLMLEQQQADIKNSMKKVFESTNPLNFTAQLLTGSFKDIKNNNWIKFFNLILFAYKKYVDTKEKGVDNPLIETIFSLFNGWNNEKENNNTDKN